MEFYEILAYTIPLAVGAVLAARITLNRPKAADKYRTKLDNSRERYISELEDDLHDAKQTMNARERGPKIEGDLGDLATLAPEIIGSFDNFAPKWLKPFLRNKEIQSAIIQKIQDDPEKYASFFGKLIGKKSETKSKDGIAPEEAL